MKYIHIILAALIFVVGGCKKVSMPGYEAGPGLYFNDVMGDSTNYSFANQVALKTTDTLFLKMIIMGNLENHERDVQLEAIDGSTAKEGVHYKLPIIKLASKAYEFLYPVVLFNTEDLKTNTVRLVLKAKANKDFPEGAAIITGSSRYAKYKVNFNNKLIKPDYWRFIQNYFGEYSDVKYKFMIDVIGISDFLPDLNGGTIVYSDFINYSGQMRKALDEYEAIHGPMLDETGKEVSFPL